MHLCYYYHPNTIVYIRVPLEVYIFWVLTDAYCMYTWLSYDEKNSANEKYEYPSEFYLNLYVVESFQFPLLVCFLLVLP